MSNKRGRRLDRISWEAPVTWQPEATEDPSDWEGFRVRVSKRFAICMVLVVLIAGAIGIFFTR